MAIFRKIHVSFWSDSFISELEKDKKLFYLYLLTNEKTTQCGIYEITKKQISFDIGYSMDTVSKLLLYFKKINKIQYNEVTKEIAIKNWLKYNGSSSPKVQSCINKELKTIKDRLLIEYVNSIDTHTQEEQDPDPEKDPEINTNVFIYSEFYDFQIELSKNNNDYIKFVKYLYGGNDTEKKLTRVLSLRDQLTYIQFEKILSKSIEKKKKLKDMLLDLENVKKYTTGRVSMYATFNSWLNR